MLVNVHEAKTHLSRLLDRVESGEEIVVGRAGKPVARLIPYRPDKSPRTAGTLKGKIVIAGDFDQTPESLIDDFEGNQ